MLGFKCFGVEHEAPREEFLGIVERKMHNKNVPVKVRPWPEPENEKDRDAIVIDMDHATGWVCAEYIASELTKYLHLLKRKKKNNCWDRCKAT